MNATALVLLIIAALGGGAYMGFLFTRLRRSAILGFAVGASAAAAGGLLMMLPMEFCTFQPDVPLLDMIIGVLLVGVGVALVILPVQWGVRFMWEHGKRRGDRVEGAFNLPIIIPFLLLAPTLVILALFLYYPAVDLFRLSTLLARLNTPRTAPRCVTNFTELMSPVLSPTTLILIAIALGLTGGLIYLRRTGQAKIYNDWVQRFTNWRSIALFGLLLSATLDLLEADYRLFVFNTFFIAGWTVILGLVIGLAIAYLAFQPVRGAAVYRTLLIWPYAISPAVAGIIFFVMFNQTSGIINHILGLIGLPEPDWFKDPWLARWTIIIASVWKTLGYNILFYIAGLQNVPKEHIEAAAIDGANAWQRFTSVVLPSLSPITFFLIITNITFAFFETFGTIDFLTRGGPAGATTVMIYQIYTLGIIQGDLGRSAAQSIVLFAMVIGITIFQFRTTGEQVSYGA